jgi:hypothetical protein
MEIECTLADGSDPSELIARAKADTTIGNSLMQGIPVSIGKTGSALGLHD